MRTIYIRVGSLEDSVTKTASTTPLISDLPNVVSSSSLKLLLIHSTSPASIFCVILKWRVDDSGARIFGFAPTSIDFVHLAPARELDPTIR